MDSATTNKLWRLARIVGGVLLAAYFLKILSLRMAGAWAPFAVDGDQNQAVWQFWRYHVKGALPAGNLLVDYAFAYHAPPAYWAVMATLSTFFEPLFAAKMLQVLSWGLLSLCVVVIVGRRTEWLLGMAAAVLVLRSPDLMVLASGGLARGFGPLLVVAFLGAYMAQRHLLCLFVLVLQAALYPPVVIACGLTYGADCVLRGPQAVRLRRCAGMLVAGLLIIGLGKYQDLVAPAWWGSMVTYEESLSMPAWARNGGRIPEVPIRPILSSITGQFSRGFKPGGTALAPESLQKGVDDVVLLGAPMLFAGVAIAVHRWRRRRAKILEPIDDDMRVPWQLFALLAGALAAYFLSRAVVWKLYLPQRQLTHTVPFLLQVGMPLLAWCAARAIVGQRRVAALVIALGLAVLPTVLLRGNGLQKGSSYKDFKGDTVVFNAIRALPLDAVIACDNYLCDGLGEFTYHVPYANRTMTHPFRRGYYDESERRLETMIKALYATSWQDFAAFGDSEKVDYFVYNLQKLKAPEKQMHLPAKTVMLKTFKESQAKGMVLENPPAEAVVFRHKDFVFIDMKKLSAWEASQRAAPTPTPTPTAPPTP